MTMQTEISTPEALPSPVNAQLASSPGEPIEAPADGKVFLSPRVVDQAAFDEYAARLRQMLARMTQHAQALAQAVQSAGSAQRQLEEAGGRQKTHLEINTKLLKALNAKVTEVQGLAGRLDEHAGMERRLESLLTSRAAELERKLEESVARFNEEIDSALATRRQALAAAVQRMDLLQRDLETKAAEAVSQTLARLAEEADRTVAELSRRVASSAEMLDHLIGRQAQLDASIRQSLESAARAEARFAVQRGLAGQLEAATDALRAGVDEARRLDAASTSNRAELIRGIEQARQMSASLAAWRDLLSGQSPDGPLPEPLARITERFRGEISVDLRRVAEAVAKIAAEASAPAPAPDAVSPVVSSAGSTVVVRVREPSRAAAEPPV
ncbi:MAG: hypothetical protein IBJ11_02360 [Phycisphaerales bacterium]|nr:hypothetical protein [Phycisphaerales bacterium]